MRIVILILAALAILLCLLQEDKSEGILSLGARTNTSKNEKKKIEKTLNIIAAVDVLALFICLLVEMF